MTYEPRQTEENTMRGEIKRAWNSRHDPLIGQRARRHIRFFLNILQSRKWELHSHKCGYIDRQETSITGLKESDGCGHVWSHDSKNIESDCQNFDEHHCPRCGTGPWYMKYRALKKAA